jgi:PAS domain S-box-containing protein
VDDEPDFAEMAATFLAREDDRFDIEIATSPAEGRDRLDNEPFDCIVSDYDMPTRNGIEFLKRVRDDHPDLPFILYTGKGSEEVASDAISAGVTDYLQKETGTSQYTVLANRIRNAVDRYYTQTELAEREKRLNLFFEQSPIGVVEWDEQFDFVRMNDAAEEILGYTQDDLLGHSWQKIVSGSDRDAVAEVVDNLLEDKGGYHSVNENVRKDGERIVCEWHNRVVTDADGAVVAIFSQFQDITEKIQQERENDRRRHRLEQILKTVPGCVVQLDADGRFVFANERAEEVLGLDSDDATGRTYNDPKWNLQDPNGEQIPDEELPFRQVRDTGEPVYGERLGIEWPNGTRKLLLVNGAPVFDEDGAFESAVFSLLDITDQQERQQELNRTRRRLELALETTDTGVYEWDMQTDEVVWSDTSERQNDRLEEFAGVVSHDLRSPLQTAQGRLELATEDCDSDHLAPVADAHDRMESIVDGLLRLAREGQNIGATETVGLTAVVEQAWAVTGGDVGKATLSLELENEEVRRDLRADRERLKQLLENIFRNAIEHGGEDVTVSVGLLEDGFYVEDDGPGIPESERETVFDVGYSSADGGTGFGLSIVRRVAEGHGWTVRATDGSTGGARFEITNIEYVE